MDYTLISWNVNGVRAIEKKGFLKWLTQIKPFVLALQETKASSDQLSEALLHPSGYSAYWCSAQKKGYSGVALYLKQQPLKIAQGLGNTRFDGEGRVIMCECKDFILFNIYFPNGGMGPERLKFKMDFYDWFLEYILKLKTKKAKIVCGDFNTAHKEIDLARPKENSNNTGFLPQERAWIDKFIKAGFIDTFREFNNEGGNYSWWDYKTRARERNIGWRIDYFFIDKKSLSHLKDAFILNAVSGSDHCPVGIKLLF